jgi:predicted nucleotidyltransferase component of viral defense system
VKVLYPTRFEEIGPWARQAQVTLPEGRVRYAQYGILRAIADSRRLNAVLVFKGGNALDFIWSPNRSTADLDFTAIDPIEGVELKEVLQASLAAASRQLGTLYQVYRVERRPRGADKPFATYAVSVGYALPDQGPMREKMSSGQPVNQAIPLDVSLNEPVCADVRIDVSGTHGLRVSTREDIAAEKLRSLLQQPIRDRYRRQDLLDIVVMLRGGPLDLGQVAAFLLLKAAARDVGVSREAFRAPEIAVRARQNYDALANTTRTSFVPFDEALGALLDFVDHLDIPER